MTICERCGTQNLDGSRYCDECGAALWLTAKASEMISSGTPGNGADGRVSRELPVSALKQQEVSSSLIPKQESSTPAPGGKRPHASLIIERGNSAGKQFFLSDRDANIGRWDADGGIFPDVDLDADDPEAKVSRRHARISQSDGEYLIEDLGSTNGTFINRGRRLTPGSRQQIKDGDEIIVGKTFLRFRVLK